MLFMLAEAAAVPGGRVSVLNRIPAYYVMVK